MFIMIKFFIKKKKLKLNQQGFTLVEVIIAFAVFAIMSLLVCTLYAFLAKMTVMSDSMNQKVDTQVGNYEETVVNPANDSTYNDQIIFNTGANTATVDIEVNVIGGNVADPKANPNIKYFTKR